MSIQTFHCLVQLCAHVREHHARYDTISFDVFDTLFIRRVHDPDLVKQAVTRYINGLAKQADVWSSYDRVKELRDSVEAEHRQINGQSNPDYEANYAQFMPEVLQKLFADDYSDALLQKVTDYEVQMENAMLVARAELVELIKFLHAEGKSIYLLSDMYLPASILRRFAEDKQLEGYFTDIISSADSFRAKASGAAFPLFQERYDVNKTRWLHIGDNPISDGLRPDEFGLDALVIDDHEEKKRKGLAKRYAFHGQKQPLWKGRYLQQLMLPLEAENIERSELYADGYQFLAYLFGAALFKLKARADLLGIKKIYFCAREGWMLKKCWEIMAPILWPEDAEQFQTEYLYVSRIALAQASRANAGLSIYDAENALRPMHNRDFTDIARVYSLDVDALMPHLQRYNLGLHEELSADRRAPDSFEKLVKLCDDKAFNDDVKAQAEPHREALLAYLDELNFFADQRVAVVDIGWLSTIQHYLVTAIGLHDDKPIVNGFLVSTDNTKMYQKTAYSDTEGLIFDYDDIDAVASMITTCKDVFEEVTRANHATLLGYDSVASGDKNSKPMAKPAGITDGKLSGKAYQLRFKPDDHASVQEEMRQFEHYTDLHEGVFAGIEKFANALSVTTYSHFELQTWCKVLIMGRLAFPKTTEVQRLQNFTHQDDFARAAEGEQQNDSAVAKKMQRYYGSVWSEPLSRLRFNPLVRLQHFLKFTRRARQR